MGYVMQFPEEDRLSAGRLELLDRIAVALAGRVVEELILGDVTTGAQNDFQQATDLARRMVTRWGMSTRLGPVALTSGDASFLGGEMEGPRAYSEATARRIDDEVREIVEGQYRRVRDLLDANRVRLETIVEVLRQRETLHHDEFAALMRGETLPEPPPVADPPEPPRAADGGERPERGSGDGRQPPGMMPEPG
jgi:cell division protease FtsH